MSLITRPGRATNRPKNPKDNRTRFAANGICKSSSMAAFFKHFDFAFTAGNEQSAANAETKAPTQPKTKPESEPKKAPTENSDPRFWCHMPHRFGLCRKSNRIIRFQYKDALTHTHSHTFKDDGGAEAEVYVIVFTYKFNFVFGTKIDFHVTKARSLSPPAAYPLTCE